MQKSENEMRNPKYNALTCLMILVALWLNSFRVQAQTMSGGPYKITSSVQAGGGGTSTGGGNKVIDGTAGQTSAGGPIGASSISHVSGFWPTTMVEPAPSQGGSPTIQFSQPTYSVQEDLRALTITVTRSGD